MKTTYKTSGVCASRIELEIEDGIIKSAQFHGGCDGNTAGISRLVIGMEAARARELLRGIRCGRKSTSCPDQLSKAIDAALEN